MVFDNIHSLRNTHLKMYLKSRWYAIKLVMRKCDHLCSEQWYPTISLTQPVTLLWKPGVFLIAVLLLSLTWLCISIPTYVHIPDSDSDSWCFGSAYSPPFWHALISLWAAVSTNIRVTSPILHLVKSTGISFDVCWPAIYSGTLLWCPPPPHFGMFWFLCEYKRKGTC